MNGNIEFEAPSRLKPRYRPEGSASIPSYFENNSQGNKSHRNNNDDASITEAIMNMWHKGRKKHLNRSKSYKNESPKVFPSFVTAAKGLLVLSFITWGVHSYNKILKEKKEAVANMAKISEQLRQQKIDSYFAGANIENVKKAKDQQINVARLAITPSKIRPHNPFLPIPKNIEKFFRDVNVARRKTDVPVFWHIHKSGGTSMKDILGECMGKVEAAEAGIMKGHDSDTELQIVSFKSNIQYVNVDTTTADGIQRAIRMNLVQSGLAEIIVSPLLHESSLLFDNTKHQGRIFALFRHPIDREVSHFYYLKKATWEPTFSEKLKKIETMEDYATSKFAVNNWMVRKLTNKKRGGITKADLAVAKEILRRKVIVGLVSDLRSASQRFMRYFGWNYNSFTPDQQKCMNKRFKGGSNRNHHDNIEEGSIAWDLLRSNNLLDLELYDYVLQLYYEQGKMLEIL